MSDEAIFLTAGIGLVVIYGLTWLTRTKDEGGPNLGYHSSFHAIAPFGTALGVVMILIAILVWLFD